MLVIDPGKVIRCDHCGYQGRALQAHRGYKWFHLPLAFLLACTGIGAIPLGIVLIYFGNRTDPTCPGCDNRKSILPWDGMPTPESEDLWAVAELRDKRQFARNKLILLGVTLLLLAGALTFAFIALRNI
jgi:hypothetical protein